MRRILLLAVIAIGAMASGCTYSNDPGGYYYPDYGYGYGYYDVYVY